MRTFKQWMVAGVLAGSAWLGANVAHADPGMGVPRVTASSVFRMPSAEAIGAAAGGVLAVNGASWIRRRRGGRDNRGRR